MPVHILIFFFVLIILFFSLFLLFYWNLRIKEAQLRQQNSRYQRNTLETKLQELNNKLQENEDERKKLLDMLELAQKQAHAARNSKSAFLANISHEIRTPMNAILGFSQLMLRDPSLTLQQRQYLDTITRSGEHLLTLIDDILEMSKIEAGRVLLTPTTFDLHALFLDLEKMFRVRADAKRIRFSMVRAELVPRYVVADESKLRQVLINLLGNAVKFTDKGGIELRCFAKIISHDNIRLMVEVEDTGHGIDTSERDILFHSFEKTESGRKTGGTGLGLAISQEIVRLMGGEITVTSTPKKGSLFRFEIGLQKGDSAHVSQRRRKISRQVIGIEPGQGVFRILIVDDKEENRRFLAQLLKTAGFIIQEATNGEDAIKAVENGNPDLILMDIQMPVMDGYEAARCIKTMGKSGKVPIIALTASTVDEEREILAKGMDGYIRKPFREYEIFEAIGVRLKIKYVYVYAEKSRALQQQETSSKTESSSMLPKDLVEEMRQATMKADIDRLLELIKKVADYDNQFAEKLTNLGEKYEYEKLLDLLNI